MVPQRPGEDQRSSYPPARSFLHHLPPPIPSAPSPHSYPSPSGHTESSWAPDRERPRSRWSPISSFDRQSSRLPALNDYPRASVSGWEAPSPSTSAYPTWATRPSVSYHTSPNKPLTPTTDPRPPNQHHLSHASTTSTPVPAPSSPGKHGSDDGPSGKKKKRRVALSCAECAKRKQRCNRETPCQHCVARRVPELCIPYTRVGSPPPRGKEATKEIKEEGKEMPAVRQPGMLPTLSVRVARIEALLNAVVNKVDGLEGKALSDWRINHAPATTPPPNDSMILSRRESMRDSRSPSPPQTANKSERESADMEGSQGDDVSGLDLDSSMRNPLPQSMRPNSKEGGVSLGLDTHGTPAEQLQKLFQDCGVSPEKVQDLMNELPNEEHANRLLEWFFTKFNYVRYPIDEHLFRKSFDELYASPGIISPRSVLFLPMAFVVFSISTRIAPDEWALSEDDKRTQSLRYYWHSKNACIISKAVKAENIQLVETMILTGLYLVLMHDRRLAEAWAEFRSAISIAQAIGLHRDGTKLRLDHYTTEYRRRLWSYLIHADATYSCLLGRPTCLDPRFSDTKSPSNLELTDILHGERPVPKPDSEPTFATYLILRRGLGEIVARVTDHFQVLGEAVQYRDVEALDEDFKSFVAALPRAFRMNDPDRSWDKKLWFLPVHRYYIQTEILHFTIILHRPWLLRKLRSNRYALSRNACIEAAASDFRIREAFKRDVPDFFETLLAGSFREFNVAMIAAISIIINPYTPHLHAMRAILQNFLEQHPHDPSLDDFSQKESAIIYTLYHRAKDLEERRRVEHSSRPMSSSLRGTQDNVSAERHEPMPSHRGTANNGFPFGPNGTPLQGKSPLTGFKARQSPMHQSGTNSPDDDQPQQLLDHWLMSNTSFGPPLSSLDPSQAVYAQPQAFPTDQNYGMPENAWVPPPAQEMMPNTGGLGMQFPTSMGFVPAPPSNFTPSHDVPGMEGQWGDGNSAQYWNNLVDRISGAMPPGYNELGIPSA